MPQLDWIQHPPPDHFARADHCHIAVRGKKYISVYAILPETQTTNLPFFKVHAQPTLAQRESFSFASNGNKVKN